MRAVAAAAVLLVGPALAACSSTTNDSHALAAAPSASASASAISYDGPEAGIPNAFRGLDTTKKLTIGWLSPNEKIPALAQLQDGISDLVEKAGGTLISKDCQLDFNTQVNQFQELIARKVDGIVVYPLNPDALGPQLEAAKNAGIPVVAINTPVKGGQPLSTGYAANVLQGFDIAAYNRAKYVATVAPGSRYGLIGLSIPVGTLKYYMERQKFWADKFGLKFVGQEDAKSDDPTGGADGMTGLIGRNPDVQTVFAYNDPAALGAAGAARSAGKSIRVLGSDAADRSTMDAVASGQLSGSYHVDQYSEGYQAATAVYTVAAGGSLDSDTVVTTGIMVTKDNAGTIAPEGPLKR
ncbi:sugar ABC transporter substrate-binding protein [Streptomyces sp. NPDC055105]|uniref:sugar ABC transporter substrate-binding protein n=1 Tax=Streptomyces sp. NPDC055105 TaxID=3365719 RepID=UPI0037D4D874